DFLYNFRGSHAFLICYRQEDSRLHLRKLRLFSCVWLGWFFFASQASSQNEFISSDRSPPNGYTAAGDGYVTPFNKSGFLQPINMNFGFVRWKPGSPTNAVQRCAISSVFGRQPSENLKLCVWYILPLFFLFLFFSFCTKSVNFGLKRLPFGT